MLSTLSFPSACSDIWILRPADDPSNVGLVYGNPNDDDCWPGTRNITTTTISPALCPSGYTSAGDATPTADASETVWACCPSGYRTDAGVYQCTSGARITYTAYTTDSAGSTTTTTLYTQGVNAHSIRVAFHSSDLLDTSPFSTPTSTSSSLPSAPATQGKGGPSFGAGIGVGIAISVVVFGLLGAALFWKIRSKNNNKTATAELEQPMSPWKPSATPASHQTLTSELPASEPARELHGYPTGYGNQQVYNHSPPYNNAQAYND